MSGTWAGVVNPKLSKLNNPSKAELDASLEFVDGKDSFGAYGYKNDAAYTFNYKGVYCNIYTDSTHRLKSLEEKSCREDRKVLCQFDCDSRNSGTARINESKTQNSHEIFTEYKCHGKLEGFMKIGDKYYRPYTDTKMNFFDAMATCHSSHATLVEFRDDNEYRALDIMRGGYG